MTQRDLERELCRATGESINTIRRRGFSLIDFPEAAPHVIDWEAQHSDRVALLPNRSDSRRATSAACMGHFT
jgi:hypothetical protein